MLVKKEASNSGTLFVTIATIVVLAFALIYLF